MGWMYELIPAGPDGFDAREGYSEEAVREMEQYVRNLPAVYQLASGCYVLAASEEMRDAIVGSGTAEQPHDYLEHIYITREKVSLQLERNGYRIQDVVRFLEWSMERWPATLLSEESGVVNVQYLTGSTGSSPSQ